MSAELTEAERDALVQAVGEHCSHTGPVDMSLPHGCRDCDEIVRVDVAGTVTNIVEAREAAARREALLEAKTLAAGRYSAWLPSPGLSSDWVAGWHAASNDITTTLQVATERDEEGGR